MMQHENIFAWAPTLLTQCYRELLFYYYGHRTSFTITITFHAWMYENINITHPYGLFVPIFTSHAKYPMEIMQWREDLYIHHIDAFHRDVGFYHDMLLHLILDHVNFFPYHLCPI